MCFIKIELFQLLFDVLEFFVLDQIHPSRASLMYSLREILRNVGRLAKSIYSPYILNKWDVQKLFANEGQNLAQSTSKDLDVEFKKLINLDYTFGETYGETYGDTYDEKWAASENF